MSAFFALIWKTSLDWLWGKLEAFLILLFKDWSDKSENKELKEKLENSETDEEQYDATEDLARKLRGRN